MRPSKERLADIQAYYNINGKVLSGDAAELFAEIDALNAQIAEGFVQVTAELRTDNSRLAARVRELEDERDKALADRCWNTRTSLEARTESLKELIETAVSLLRDNTRDERALNWIAEAEAVLAPTQRPV